MEALGDRRRIILEVKLARPPPSEHEVEVSSSKGEDDHGTTNNYNEYGPRSNDDDYGPRNNYEYGASLASLLDRSWSSSSTSDEDEDEDKKPIPTRKDLNASFQDAVVSMTRAFVDFSVGGGTKAVSRFSSLLGRSDVGSLKSCEDVERVARDFYSQATLYGRVIISEMGMPDEEKTVKPVQMGGTLGGKKFLVRGILFKFGETALFPQYADPWYVAQKIQGHEMKGLAAYFAHFFNRYLLWKVVCVYRCLFWWNWGKL